MPIFDRFDICSAYYLFGMEYHSGQWSREYAYIGRALNCGFGPGPMFRDRNSLSENGQEIYDALVEKHLARSLAYIAPAKG
jgi:hypothetical protein